MPKSFFEGKRLVDIGCGPRGTLEWAHMAAERIGIDPLATDYLRLGARRHRMKYVNARAEDIPYPDGYFDVVFSGNALDHVEDVDGAISEIKRVTAPNGTVVLITELRSSTDLLHPQSLSLDLVNEFEPEFEVDFLDVRKKEDGDVYGSARRGVEYDPSRHESGVLSARLTRVA